MNNYGYSTELYLSFRLLLSFIFDIRDINF